MAINIDKTPREGKPHLGINMSNGHLETLEKIVRDYGFPSEKEAISFMLGVTAQANGGPIEIEGTKYVPSEALKGKKS